MQSDDILVNPLPTRFTLGGYGKASKLKLAYPPQHFRVQPRFDGRYSAIKALFDSADVVIGFAVQNDIKYINNACDKFSLPRIPFKFLDVQLIVGHLIPEVKNNGLKTVADRFEIEFLEHRSDEDARVTYEVLMRALKESGKTLDEVVEEFGVVYGVNGQGGHTNCYSARQIEERIALNSKAFRKLLVNYYIDNMPNKVLPKGGALEGKGVCLAESAYAKTVDDARKVICTTLKQGGRYESSLLKCNYFITGSGDKNALRGGKVNLRKVRVMTAQAFLEEFGSFDYPFDSTQILTEKYSALISDRAPEE